MSIKVALFGIVGYARTYVAGLTQLQDSGEIDFEAAVIVNPAESPETVEDFKKRGIRIFPDADSFYRAYPDGIDLVCFPTAIASHAPLTVQALEHNCNVLVEKPLSGSMAGARSIAEAERRTGKTVMVGYQHLYLPALQQIKKHLISGTVGKVKRIVTMGLWPRGNTYYARNAWVGKMAVNGTPVCDSPINNAFAHYLNLSLFFAGKEFADMMIPVRMQAEMYRVRRTIETFDNCALKVTSADGIEILALFSHTCPENVHPSIRVECENGSALWADGIGWQVADKEGKILDSGDVTNIDRNVMFRDALAKLSGKEVFTSTAAGAAVQTFCIDQLHKHFDIKEIASEYAVQREEDGVYLLEGIEKYWREAAEKFLMPSETAAPWAVKSAAVELEKFSL